MISYLASPKPFRGVAKTIQYRAIKSWLASSPGSEVILYGTSDGIEQAGLDLGARVVTEVGHAPSGIPYFGTVVAHAAAHARHDCQVYLNCDILLAGAVTAFARVSFPRFLMIGRRIDLAHDSFVDICRGGWQDELLGLSRDGQAHVHPESGIDYFAFRRGTWEDLPPIIIGRAGYDNAIMVHCLRLQIPIVDATEGIVALHQFHDYGHVPGGKAAVFSGAEARANFAHAGGTHSRTLISDASHVLRNGRVMAWPCRGDLLRRLELRSRFEYGWPHLGLALRLPWRALRALGLLRQSSPTIPDLVQAVDSEGPT